MTSRNQSPLEENPGSRGETIDGPVASKLPAGLYLVATPIGNLGDISHRAIATLRSVDRIAAEDTRVTRRLLSALAIGGKRVERYDDHADEQSRARLLGLIAGGEAIALVSDAGTPLIADPGFKLVRAAREAGLRVTGIPGASAPVLALALSGLPSDRFYFAGFLPPKSGARRSELQALATIAATLIVFEAPSRLAASLADMAATLGADRPAVIARELTKLFEEIRPGTLGALAEFHAAHDAPKGEIVVIIGPPLPEAAGAAPQSDIDAQLDAALTTLSLRDAVAAVAGATGQPRRLVYARALARAQERKR